MQPKLKYSVILDFEIIYPVNGYHMEETFWLPLHMILN